MFEMVLLKPHIADLSHGVVLSLTSSTIRPGAIQLIFTDLGIPCKSAVDANIKQGYHYESF